MFLDALPLWVVLLSTVLLALLAVELGYRLGRSWQRRTHSEKEGPVGAMTGATLGLLAFLLAFTTNMAAGRFDNRRTLVVEEANAIGTTFLRAGFLDQPMRSEARGLLSEYVDTRLSPVSDPNKLDEALARSEQIQIALWSQLEPIARDNPESPVLALYIETLNEMIDVHGKRAIAVTSSRIPGNLWLSIYTIAMLTMMLLGLQTSYGERRNWLSLIVLVAVFSLVLSLIVDLDRPNQGLLTVNQQALLGLQAQIKAVMP